MTVLSAFTLQGIRTFWRGLGDTGPYIKAAMTYEEGLEHDPENEELKDGLRRARAGIKKEPRAAMAVLNDTMKGLLEGGEEDPELHAIMFDPVILQVVSDFKANPMAAAAQMKKPEVAAKVQKLVDAGIIKL